MISLKCTNCQTGLDIDDAFAGGVCRCQHCGAIQTVPSHFKAKAKSPRTLYAKAMRGSDTGQSSGLEDLANVVVSSGLMSERLRRKSRKPVFVLLLIAAVLIAIAAIVIAIWPASDSPAKAPISAGPAFCGVPLNGKLIIYVLDRGSGTADQFSYLKEAAYRSIQSLGSDRKFQIIFWYNGTDEAHPPGGPAFATPQNLEMARRALDLVFASGQSDAKSAMTKAVAANPDAIVIATGKGAQIDEEFAGQIMQIRGDKAIKIHTFDLGGGSSPALSAIAQLSGGEARVVSEGELKRYGKE